MILLNFSHPITNEQESQIKRELGLDVTGEQLDTIKIVCQMDVNEPFDIQVEQMIDVCDLSANEWQTKQLLVNLPALSTAATLLLAELHGRCGYYPPALRLKQESGIVPPRYVLAEILDINGQRQNARKRR